MNATSSSAKKPLPTRRSRRATVVVIYFVFALLTTAVLAAEAVGTVPVLENLLFYAVILSAFGAFFFLKRNVRGVADLPDAELDERQLADRNRTYKTAYRFFAIVMVPAAAFYIYVVAGGFDLPMPNTVAQGNVVFWWVWLLAVSLPSSIMGWKEPDLEEGADVQ